ncbi:hypothetical protein L6164_028506 [Bauhinia variegata]|uniref:Uncharacterized protein n=1 Tax=Bauhinia variegata TaxID=167791 RepID=A0ACB9L6H8_BAUVA|nr:hypothetical protein L6164_028506 [Bauhinia variegata]
MAATEIPEWFDHRNKGEIISFWIRQKLPVVALAFSFKNLTKLENEILSQSIGTNFDVHIFINGIEVLSKFLVFPIVGGHLRLFDLQDIFTSEEWMTVDAFLLQDWNHVEVCCSNSQPELPELTVEYYGVHVYKQETNMEDIRFHNPFNLSKRPASFSPQHGRPKKLIKKYEGDKDKGKDKLFNS